MVEAVQVQDHGQLRAAPADGGQQAGLQVAVGQLGQGIGGPLTPAAGVTGVGGAGHRVQGGQDGLAGLGL